MSKKFYKTVITVEVLSESPYKETNLETIAFDIKDGECSGNVNITSEEELTSKQMVDALKNQGSDTEFFNLDEEGNDLDE